MRGLVAPTRLSFPALSRHISSAVLATLVIGGPLSGCSNDDTTAPRATAPSCVDYGDAPHWVSNTDGETYDVAVSGSYLFSTSGNGFNVFQIGTDRIPKKMVGVSVDQGMYRRFFGRFALSNSHVYSTGLEVIDVSNPESPVITGRVDLHAYDGDVAVSGSNAYVFTDANGIYAEDFTLSTSRIRMRRRCAEVCNGPVAPP